MHLKRDYRPHGPERLDKALSFDQVKEHRNTCCGLYGICLAVVVRRRWTSFSCRPCSLFQSGARQPGNSRPAKVLPLAARR